MAATKPWAALTTYFTSVINMLTRFGNRKSKLVKPRRQKLRDTVKSNRQIARMYNVCAAAQVATQKRLTYRLPIIPALEVEVEDVDMDDWKDDGETETIEDGKKLQKEKPSVREPVVCAVFERHADGSLALKVAETSQVVGRTKQTQSNNAEVATGNTSLIVSIEKSDVGMRGAEMSEEAPIAAGVSKVRKPKGAKDVIEQEGDMMTTIPTNKALDQASNVEEIPQSSQAALPLHWSAPLKDTHLTITPAVNPEEVPIQRVQVVQTM
jgi:hypothetical protein